MNQFDHTHAEAHTAFLRSLDERAALEQGAGAQQSGETPSLARQRMAQARLLLIAGGETGRQAVLALRRLPLRHLTIWPLRKQDQLLFQGLQDEPGALGRLQVLPQLFSQYAASTAFKAHQLVAFASSRPHPGRQRAINDLCVRHGLPFVQLSLNAHEIHLGPTVLPGATACQACYEVRALASAAKPDVHKAQIEFFDRNPDFEFKGQLRSLDCMAAEYLCSEIERLTGGQQTPLALSRLLRMDGLYLSQERHFVPYYEWCPVCRGEQPASSARPNFADFIAACEGR